MSDRDDFGFFVVGFFIGALAGAVTALLMAPQSGEETRTLIHDKGVEVKEKSAATLEEARLKANTIVADARVKADASVADARAKADEVMANLRQEQASTIEAGTEAPAVEPPAA